MIKDDDPTKIQETHKISDAVENETEVVIGQFSLKTCKFNGVT